LGEMSAGLLALLALLEVPGIVGHTRGHELDAAGALVPPFDDASGAVDVPPAADALAVAATARRVFPDTLTATAAQPPAAATSQPPAAATSGTGLPAPRPEVPNLSVLVNFTHRLEAMSHRAEVFRMCVSQGRWRRAHAQHMQSMIIDTAQHVAGALVYTCIPANLSYHWVYKNGGESTVYKTGEMCNQTYGELPEEMEYEPMLHPHSSYVHTTFAFGRSVVSRFVSAAAEVARRLQLLSGIRSHLGENALNRTIQAIENEDADELALIILKETVRRNWDTQHSPVGNTDAWQHLDPQAVFLTHPTSNQFVLTRPQLAFIGQVESFDDDFRAVMAAFFGEVAASEMDLPHVGDSEEYDASRVQDEVTQEAKTGDVVSAIDVTYHDRILKMLSGTKGLSNRTMAAIKNAYAVDDTCIQP